MATFRPEEENSVYIGDGAEMTGAIRARDNVVIDGSFDGEIFCDHLLVGPTGIVKGKIEVSSADISGHVSADIVAKHLLSVRATGQVEGKWECGALEVARGGVLDGAVHMAQGAAVRREAIPEPEEVIEAEFVEEEEVEAPAAIVAPLRQTPRLAQLNLRMPRRRAG